MQSLRTAVPIRISRIKPHPDNPRKDLGDLTELTASIRKEGILQDITIIPDYCLDTAPEEQAKPTAHISDGGSFYVLMGHRRLAAFKAQAFGDEEVMCKVAWGLSHADQIGIMLEENVQRNELTVPEQIESFQLMLDLGESVNSISEKTGFSASTVYKRIKNADIVEDLKEIDDGGFQLSIADLTELAKVDTEAKKDILKRANNSNDVKYYVEQNIKNRERVKKQNEVLEVLAEKGVLPYDKDAEELHGYWWELDYVIEIDINNPDYSKVRGDEYYSIPNTYTERIPIRRPCSEEPKELSEEEIEKAKKEAREKQKVNTLSDIITALETNIKDFLGAVARCEYSINNRFGYGHFEGILAKYHDQNGIDPDYLVGMALEKDRYSICDDDYLKFQENGYVIDVRAAFLATYLYQETYTLITWDGRYQDQYALCWNNLLTWLEEAGYKIPDIHTFDIEGIPEDEDIYDILAGTSKLYKEDK